MMRKDLIYFWIGVMLGFVVLYVFEINKPHLIVSGVICITFFTLSQLVIMSLKTDLESFIDLYKRFGIDVKVNEVDKNKSITLSHTLHTDEKETTHESFGGYEGFSTTITFSHEGKYIGQDFWE